VLGLDHQLLAVRLDHPHAARRQQGRGALPVLAAIGLEELAHPGGELADHALLPRLHAGEIHLEVAHLDAELRGVAGLLEELGRVDEGLRRDAADVEADSAGGRLLDHQDFLAELAQADAGDVAARTGADDDDFDLEDLGAHERILSIETAPGHPA